MLWHGYISDITEQKRVEEELARESYKNKMWLRNASDGVHILDEQGNLLDASDSFCCMLGYTRVELVGMSVRRWDAWLTGGQVDQALAEQFERAEMSKFETRHRRKDGSEFDVEVTGYPLEVNGQRMLFNASRDISERKQQQAELAQYRSHLENLVQQRTSELLATETRASHILQSTADGLYGLDAAGLITFINPAACQMLGYSAEQIIGRAAHALFHHSKPDGSPYPLAASPSYRALQSGEKIRIDSEVYWHADGHAIPVMYAVHPMLEKGRIAGAVTSFVDITEQRAVAAAREQALSAAESLARVRSEFLSNMSHEIRTPLNGVLGFANIGFRHFQNAEKARDAFQKILTSGNRLLGIINDILDFSKIEAGRLSIEATTVSLVEVIEHSVELVRDRAQAKHLDLKIALAPDFPTRCVSDPLRMGQVLLNVLSNAVKFTESGSVTLSATLQGEQLRFKVSDTGIGMDDALLGQLFNPFQQADASSTRKFGGTGLGLAISKRIVEMMGGSIGVESQLGSGSAVEFRLPYVAPALQWEVRPSHPVAGADAYPLAGISILVAEDEPLNQAVLQENLIESGAAVVMVGNGLEAVERVLLDGRDAYDIVLMDIQMPELDGCEAARRIGELAPGLPIIAQTAHAFGEERARCFAAGMVGHIAKPIDPDELRAIILRYVKSREKP